MPRTPWEPPGENLSFLTLSVSYSAIQIVTLFKRFHLEEPIILNVICELLCNSNSYVFKRFHEVKFIKRIMFQLFNELILQLFNELIFQYNI